MSSTVARVGIKAQAPGKDADFVKKYAVLTSEHALIAVIKVATRLLRELKKWTHVLCAIAAPNSSSHARVNGE
jgi:hypothetical protein